MAWDLERLQWQWALWSAEERAVYTSVFNEFKPQESEPLQAANIAAYETCVFRRRQIWDEYYRREEDNEADRT